MASKNRWTSDQIGTLRGRVVVVTGANSGIGLETARQLAAHGAEVVLACRDDRAGREAAARIASEVPDAAVRSAVLDLANLRTVKAFAEECLEQHPELDILINNAGVAGGPRRITADGFELHFGTNYLGHFALTSLLMPALLARPAARVVTVSSSVAARGRIVVDDPQSQRRYRFVDAYAQSKLACLMFALELDRRVKRDGLSLRSIATDPGIVKTGLLRPRGAQRRARGAAERAVALTQWLFGQPLDRGALTSLYAATEPSLQGGEYVAPDGAGHKRGHPTVIELPERSLDAVAASRLWELAAELTGVPVVLDHMPGARD